MGLCFRFFAFLCLLALPCAGSRGGELRPDLADTLEKAARDKRTFPLILTRNGDPSAARIRILKDAEAKALYTLPGLPFFWADGRHELRLGPGRYRLEISAGPRTWPWQGALTIQDTTAGPLEYKLQSYLAVQRQGWWLCDPYVGCERKSEIYTYGEVKDVCLAARGEGLEAVGIGHPERLRHAAGTHYDQLRKGDVQLELALHNETKDHFAPFFAFVGSLPSGARYYALTDQPRLALNRKGSVGPYFQSLAGLRQKQALTVLHRPLAKPVAGELVFDCLAGPHFDALDIGNDPVGSDLEHFALWTMLLNRGHRIPAVAGGPGRGSPDIPAGRLYLYHSQRKLTARAALDAISSGRSVVSNGPFVTLQVLTAGPGDTLHPSAKPYPVRVLAFASASPKDSIAGVDILYNGKIVYTWTGGSMQRKLDKTIPLKLPDVGWLVARYRCNDKSFWAFTNPVYLSAPGYAGAVPVQAGLTLSVLDSRTEKPLQAAIQVSNFGQPVMNAVHAGKATRLDLPATAVLEIRAQGYKPLTISLYGLGPAKTLAAWAGKASLKDLLKNPNTYAAMKQHLQNIQATVRLKPVE